MGMLYRFSRLIQKYSVDCQIRITGRGQWNAGEWVEKEPELMPYRCAVVPITERRISNSGGAYKAGDCEIITRDPIPLETDVYILHKGKIYKIEQNRDCSDYADFCNYIGKRVSSFDKSAADAKNADRRA